MLLEWWNSLECLSMDYHLQQWAHDPWCVLYSYCRAKWITLSSAINLEKQFSHCKKNNRPQRLFSVFVHVLIVQKICYGLFVEDLLIKTKQIQNLFIIWFYFPPCITDIFEHLFQIPRLTQCINIKHEWNHVDRSACKRYWMHIYILFYVKYASLNKAMYQWKPM